VASDRRGPWAGDGLDPAADRRVPAARTPAPPLRPVPLVAFRGLRRGEGVGLPWTDVDLKGKVITISQQIVQQGWETETSRPKSDAGEREVALDTGTVTAFRAHRRQQLAERAEWGELWIDTGLVFTMPNGEPLHPADVTGQFHRLAREAGLPPIRLHDLRHGAATLALAAGIDRKVVQEMLGHSSEALTADTYTSVLPELQREAADAIAALLTSAADTPGRIPGRTEVRRATLTTPRKRDRAISRHGERPSQGHDHGCAARDSNPEPAD
jgi:integrase